MKLYNYRGFLNESKNENIHEICKEYGIENYTINLDGSIDVDGHVSFLNINFELDVLPLNFNRVNSFFDCSYNEIVSLEGCPNYVGGNFTCNDNKLKSLKGGPEYVGGVFNCSNNNLTTLKGGPKTVIGDYKCKHNNIKDFDGFPEYYYGSVYFGGNPVDKILSLIPLDKESKFIHLINEYDVIRNGNTIIRDRLEAAYEGIEMELPENITIKGYEII